MDDQDSWVSLLIAGWVNLFIILIFVKYDVPFEVGCLLIGLMVASSLAPAAWCAYKESNG